MSCILSPRRVAFATAAVILLAVCQVAQAWQSEPLQPVEPSEAIPPAARFVTPRPAENSDAPTGNSSGPVVRAAPAAEPEVGQAPADDSQQSGTRDVQTATFQGIVPGKSTLDQVKRALGEPAATGSDGGVTHLEYRIAPFPKVEVMATSGVATSIVIHLGQPSPPDQIAKELGLHEFPPAPVPEESGRLLGQAYPERGVLFVFVEDQQNPLVSHIVLEPISAEPFVMRVLHDGQHQYRRDLADLDAAQKLDPQNARVYALRARILGSLGRTGKALENVSQAVSLEEHNLEYRLLGAELSVAAGKFEQPLELAEAVAAQPAAQPLARGRAEMLWGNILSAGAGGNFQEAVKHHTKAIELLAPLARNEQASVRHEARRLLIDAHLAVARDVACGNWRNKEPTVNKWIGQAARVADDTVERDDGDPLLRLRVFRGKLAALACIKGTNADPRLALSAAMKTVNDALAVGADPLFRGELEWQLGEAQFDAALVQQSRGDADAAIQLGSQALALLEKHAPGRDADAAQHYLLGQVCFRVGSFYAVGKSDHQHAVEWYQKALLQFANPLPDTAAAEIALHGERYVSMGASYWKTGQQKAGLQLTQQGVELIENAVESGQVPERVLAVPYANLAAMHRQSGNDEQAEDLSRMARQYAPRDGAQQR